MGFSILTERLILDDMNSDDLPNIMRVAEDTLVMKYVLIWLENDEQIQSYLKHAIEESKKKDRRDYVLAVRLLQTREFAGISFIEIDPHLKTTAEIGCVLLQDYWNYGYASEILQAYLTFGFEQLSMHRIYGKCDSQNNVSAYVLEKGGLKYEGTHRENVWLRDHWRSTKYYSILEGEYSNSPIRIPE